MARCLVDCSFSFSECLKILREVCGRTNDFERGGKLRLELLGALEGGRPERILLYFEAGGDDQGMTITTKLLKLILLIT